MQLDNVDRLMKREQLITYYKDLSFRLNQDLDDMKRRMVWCYLATICSVGGSGVVLILVMLGVMSLNS